MSPQAYGAAVLDACPAANGTCEALLGDELWDARRSKLVPLDTEGGEPFLLYFLKALQTGGALPDSVCPYIATAGHDHRCPGLKAAQARNPLRFTVSALRSHYERKAVKAALLRGKTLSLSTSMMAVTFCRRARAPPAASSTAAPPGRRRLVRVVPARARVHRRRLLHRRLARAGVDGRLLLPAAAHVTSSPSSRAATRWASSATTMLTARRTAASAVRRAQFGAQFGRAILRGSLLHPQASSSKTAGGTACRRGRRGTTRAARTRSATCCSSTRPPTRRACARTRTRPSTGRSAPICTRAGWRRPPRSRARRTSRSTSSAPTRVDRQGALRKG